MKKFFWSPLVASTALVIVLAGCASPATTPAAAPSATGDLSTAAAPVDGTVAASAIVTPARTAQMGFLVSGTVKEVAVKVGDKVQTGQTLMVLDAPELDFGVAGAEAGVRSAQAEAQYWIYPRKGEPPERRLVANAQLQQAQAALDDAEAVRAQGTLVAPFDGTVVQIAAPVGELVQPGQIVVVIGDLDHLQLETTDLSERGIANVQVGQDATVRLKAFDQALTGKVIRIAPMGAKSGGDVVFKVTIELDAPPEGLMWGMSGDVEIRTK